MYSGSDVGTVGAACRRSGSSEHAVHYRFAYRGQALCHSIGRCPYRVIYRNAFCVHAMLRQPRHLPYQQIGKLAIAGSRHRLASIGNLRMHVRRDPGGSDQPGSRNRSASGATLFTAGLGASSVLPAYQCFKHPSRPACRGPFFSSASISRLLARHTCASDLPIVSPCANSSAQHSATLRNFEHIVLTN